MKNKLDEVHEIFIQWKKSKISASEAIEKIDEIMNYKCVIGRNIKITNASTGKLVYMNENDDYYEISFCEKR
jgi:hypothetical protein